MMEPGSFTSEPQYQRPDERNDMVPYIRKAEVVQPGPVGPLTGTRFTYLDPTMAGPLFNKFGRDPWIFNRLDFYGNSIILGAMCNALAFIIYGFYRCKVYRVNDTFLWSVILLFGGLGQITAGFLEYCKGRSFTTTLYLCLGFYCLSHYAYYVMQPHFLINQNTSIYYTYDNGSLSAFYSAWCVIAFALLLGSIKTNLLYILQVALTFGYFLLRAVGEGCNSLGTKRNAAGILEAIAGFFSLLIGISQILNNETFYNLCFPTFPMCPDNEIDILPDNYIYHPGLSPTPLYGLPNNMVVNGPVINQPVAPIDPGVPVVPVVPVEQPVPVV